MGFHIPGRVSNHEVTRKCVCMVGGGTISLASPGGGGLTAGPHLTSLPCTFPGSDVARSTFSSSDLRSTIPSAPISRQPVLGTGEVWGFAQARCTEVAAAGEGARRRRTLGAAVVGAPCQEGRGRRGAHAEAEKEGAGRVWERVRHKKRERARRRRRPPLEREAGVRLCEAPHFNEVGPRHIPALAAAAETPARPQLLQPSPGPAAPQPRPRPARRGQHQEAAPRAATKTPGGVSPRTGAWFAFSAEGSFGARRPGARRRLAAPAPPAAVGRRGARGAEGRADPRLGLRRPARRSSKGAALPWPAWPRLGRRVRAAPGLLAPASFVWCHPA